MKKILAVVLALVLCLSLASMAIAEEIEEVTVELDESYVTVDLGEQYAMINLPADWLAIDASYSDENGQLLGTFANPDGTQMILATYVEAEEATTYEAARDAAVAGGASANLVIINGFEFLNIAAVNGDQAVIMSTYFVDEACTCALTLTFTFPAADVEAFETIATQVAGSLDFYA